MAKIYLSSTFNDLKGCRKDVYDSLRSMHHDVIAMEHYVAADRRPLDKSLSDVADCDIYIGIFAWRYGYIPEKDNPEQRSITELEFRHAVKTGKIRLIFLLNEDAPWPRSMVDSGEEAERLSLLRKELSEEYLASFFMSCEELARQASTAVANCLDRNRAPSDDKPASLDSHRVNLTNLPRTESNLFGRDRELRQLDDAWAQKNTHVLSLVAWGGVGKSALVNHWLARMAQDNYRGASRVYAWSFYSQGTSDRAVSANQFIEAALTWLGDPDPDKGSAWDKGVRLGQLVGAQRALLVLDGLEPLQYPPGHDEGRLKDQALQALLRQFAAYNEGLCIISTRVAVTDLSPFEGRTTTRIDLETLYSKAGAEVLRAQGVRGTQAELEQASEEFGGHSLALTLLGSYLSDVYGGKVSHRGEVRDLEGDVRYGGHAQKVMASYEKWFGEGPELAVLRVLGLFNRPADRDAIATLRATPIPGLTDALQGLSDIEWQRTLAKLRHAKLLGTPNPNQSGALDTHPLVREHFRQRLKQTRPDAWREGNNRLYEHLKPKVKKIFLPDTIEKMALLYTAMSHGCEAGRHQEALDEVYWRRILRGFSFPESFSFGDGLAALVGFFDPPWLQPVAELTENAKAFVLNEAGLFLRALGRLEEAVQPMQASLMVRISQTDWDNAANSANNLSEIYLTIGDLSQALTYAQQSVELADQSGDSFSQVAKKTTLADALHQAGRLPVAEAAFREAEERHKQIRPDLPFLYSLPGLRYCNLLLAQGKYQEVQNRLERLSLWRNLSDPLLDIALENLALGRAHLLQALHEAANDFSQATSQLNQAVNGLRRAGTLHHLPSGLLARAELSRVKREFDRVQADLYEALDISTRGSMGLHQADCHLEYARLYLAQGEREKARESWARAREMIERMGYHRRHGDVREIGEQLGEGSSKSEES